MIEVRGDRVVATRMIKPGTRITRYTGQAVVVPDLTPDTYSITMSTATKKYAAAAAADAVGGDISAKIRDSHRFTLTNDMRDPVTKALRVSSPAIRAAMDEYIRHSVAAANINIEISTVNGSQVLYVVATKRIAKGNELFMTRGVPYWLGVSVVETNRTFTYMFYDLFVKNLRLFPDRIEYKDTVYRADSSSDGCGNIKDFFDGYGIAVDDSDGDVNNPVSVMRKCQPTKTLYDIAVELIEMQL